MSSYRFSNIELRELLSDSLVMERGVSLSSSKWIVSSMPKLVYVLKLRRVLKFFVLKRNSLREICGQWCYTSRQSCRQWRVDSFCCPQGLSECSVAQGVVSISIVLV